MSRIVTFSTEQKNASPPVKPNAAVSGFMQGIEFLKADQVAKEATMLLNIGQKLSIPMILLGIGFLVYSFINRNKIPAYTGPKASPEERKSR